MTSSIGRSNSLTIRIGCLQSGIYTLVQRASRERQQDAKDPLSCTPLVYSVHVDMLTLEVTQRHLQTWSIMATRYLSFGD
jgi:hypothetical protein